MLFEYSTRKRNWKLNPLINILLLYHRICVTVVVSIKIIIVGEMFAVTANTYNGGSLGSNDMGIDFHRYLFSAIEVIRYKSTNVSHGLANIFHSAQLINFASISYMYKRTCSLYIYIWEIRYSQSAAFVSVDTFCFPSLLLRL